MKRSNPIGIISMFYARPFTRENFSCLRRAKDAGCDFIELLVPEPGEIDLAETRAALADHGLGVELAARVNLQRDLASEDEAAHRNGVAYLESTVAIAERLGAHIVGGPLYGAPLVFAGRAPSPVTDDQCRRRMDRVIAGLKQAAKRASDAGVVFGVEPLNRFETDIANTTRHGIDIVARVDHAAVGVMLDTFHMNMEDPSIPTAIRDCGKRLVHFQANENNRDFLGAGHIDWPEVCRALKDIGYAGPITLEPFRRDENRAGISLAQWRAPTTSEDEELKQSVQLLDATLAFAGRAR
ncbi:MAG: sugar phosphate isomerase/epimerase family protein [Beijerinckiaceae bacterium]